MAGGQVIGLDTNILLRLIDRSNEAQSISAGRLIASAGAQGCFVNNIVLSEFAWTLARTYKRSRQEIVETISFLVASSEIKLENMEQCNRALAAYQTGKADFADCLLGEINKDFGCATTMTFDVVASGSPAFTLMEPI